jgi:hypothetical protein
MSGGEYEQMRSPSSKPARRCWFKAAAISQGASRERSGWAQVGPRMSKRAPV